MGAELSLRNLRQVERGVEQALRNFTRGEGNGIRPPAIAACEPVDKMSALAIAEVGETMPMRSSRPAKPQSEIQPRS
jgi:hypothetical protein